MERLEILRPLWRWWWLILIPTVITFVASLPALPGVISPPETYGASLRFSAAAPPSVANEIAASEDNLARSGTYEDTSYVPWLASEYLVVNIPQWVTSSSFATAVSEQLAAQAVDISADDLRPAFNADGSRSVFIVYYGWDDEAELEQIMAASVVVLQTQNHDVFPQLGGEPATIIQLDDIDVVRTAPPLTARLRPFLQIFIGLGAGVGLAYLAAYLDNEVRDRDDLEALGLVVVGEIPK